MCYVHSLYMVVCCDVPPIASLVGSYARVATNTRKSVLLAFNDDSDDDESARIRFIRVRWERADADTTRADLFYQLPLIAPTASDGYHPLQPMVRKHVLRTMINEQRSKGNMDGEDGADTDDEQTVSDSNTDHAVVMMK